MKMLRQEPKKDLKYFTFITTIYPIIIKVITFYFVMFLVFLLLFWGSDQNEMRHIHLIISLRWSLNAGLFVGIYYYSFAVLPLRTSVVLKGNRVESCRVTSRIDLHRFLTSRSKVHLLVAMDSHVIRFSWVDVAVKLESKKKIRASVGPCWWTTEKKLYGHRNRACQTHSAKPPSKLRATL